MDSQNCTLNYCLKGLLLHDHFKGTQQSMEEKRIDLNIIFSNEHFGATSLNRIKHPQHAMHATVELGGITMVISG